MTDRVGPHGGASRRRLAALAATALTLSGALALVAVPAGGQTAPDRSELGRFSRPFEEPTLSGRTTQRDCIRREPRNAAERQADPTRDGYIDCKPAAASTSVAYNGRIPYWNALEGTENITGSIVFEYGVTSINDQSRVLTLRPGEGPTFRRPKPVDGGANRGGSLDRDPLIPGAGSTEPYNDGALFCADQNWLPDGRLLAVGGTQYSRDPGVNALPVGATELSGIKSSRIWDPATNRWTQTGDMNRGRWYPTLVTLGSGDMFVASGVHKLVKPAYAPDPTDPDPEPPVQDSGRNVTVTERFDSSTGDWTSNGRAARRSLPLFPRMHLLPNGHVYYDAAGQSFNPFGQAVDEAGWSIAASYDPKRKRWQDLGVPGLTTGRTADPGFRGSTFSTMLPLEPNARGRYTKAEFLTAGGLAAPAAPSPGTYAPVKSSRIAKVVTRGGEDRLRTRETGPLNEPTAENEPGDLPTGRWYSSGTLLPTGEVLATAGADRDEVALPGTEHDIRTAEIFDPRTETWRSVAEAKQPRTYHNTAVLLPSGRVLIGGHATITTAYANNGDIPGAAPNGHDPTFEMYSPPYMFRGERPRIQAARECMDYDGRMRVDTDIRAKKVASVMLVRNVSTTHVIDGDQRTIELDIVRRRGSTVTVAEPPNGNVAPPGPYMLFVNKRTPRGLIPSKAKQVAVGQAACKGFGSELPEDPVRRPNRDRDADRDRRLGGGAGPVDSGGGGSTAATRRSADVAATVVEVGAGTSDGSADLPFTGLTLALLAATGLALLGAGLTLVHWSRRAHRTG